MFSRLYNYVTSLFSRRESERVPTFDEFYQRRVNDDLEQRRREAIDDYPKSRDQIKFATFKKPILDALLLAAEKEELAHQKDLEEARAEYEAKYVSRKA